MVRGAGARTDLSADELPADCRRPPWNVDAQALERDVGRIIDSRLVGQVADVEVVTYDLDEEITSDHARVEPATGQLTQSQSGFQRPDF